MQTTDPKAGYVKAYSCRSCQSLGTCKDLKAGIFCSFALSFAGVQDKQQVLGGN